MKEKVIAALDVETEEQALSLTKKLKDYVGAFKVGLQLYNNVGPGIVKKIADQGCKVFLDLKFHDIPNTVAGAAEAVVGLGAFMFNVHAAGGKKMMQEAVKAAQRKAAQLGIAKPLIIGVTVLTSMTEAELQQEIGIQKTLPEQVAALALSAKEAGLDGVVASAQEIPWIREVCGTDFLIVTPGIRPTWAASDDQARIVTPQQALDLGADYLVIGRPLTAAADPREAAQRLWG
ncbi:MAG: orotidine-5'-phosphate decarboxylase [Firmicutes bacterium]|jgi:orotidine-5'-phosphate decarboxylase|nr:orotidine-5'-phosphate decarboxylase [Bacillota bacterium]